MPFYIDRPGSGLRYTGPVHDVAEYNVCALLQGDIDTSYTQADNSVVVPTDTVKNTVYCTDNPSPFVPFALS
jgi:urate oxidase